MSKKIPIIVILAILFVFAGYKGYHHFYPSLANNTLTLYGNVDIRDVNLAFRVFGRIADMKFEEGDHVTKGTVLATLDKDTFEEELALAKAGLFETEAELKSNILDFERFKTLVKVDAVSQANFEKSLAARDKSQAHLQTAKVHIKKAEIALADTEIQAPFDGIILTRVREPGAIVSAGQTVYTLAMDDLTWIRTYVSEVELGNVYPGQKALVFTDSEPDKPYHAQVGFISPQAEFTPKNVETTQLRTDLVYRLRVIVNKEDQSQRKGLRQGMPVTVKLLPREKNDK